jgi:SAM-dependent methyltransferase
VIVGLQPIPAAAGIVIAITVDHSLIRSPASGLPVVPDPHGAGLMTASGERFETIAGVPVLLRADHPLFASPSLERQVTDGGCRRRLRDKLPHSTRSLGTSERFARYVELVVRSSTQPLVLVIGGGVLGHGMTDVAADSRIQLIETDVYRGPRTQIICDAHELPFPGESFDGVIVQAVLEHVMDPQKVASEIHRVLKPGGLVYSEIPFMQQVHEGAYDVTRYTLVGHRRLFRWFDEVDSGVVAGPGTALLWAIRYAARALPRRSRSAANVFDALALVGFFWLKYLDDIVITHAGAVDGASATWFMGTKGVSALSDRDVIETYRGVFRPAPR